MRVVLLPAAARDVEEAYAWYERDREGRGRRFVVALDECLRLVGELPKKCPVVAPGRDERRALVSGFPYLVYYVEGEDRVDVFAVLHSRRHPNTWSGRRERG